MHPKKSKLSTNTKPSTKSTTTPERAISQTEGEQLLLWLKEHIWHERRALYLVAIILFAIGILRLSTTGEINNYLIFARSWDHLLQGTSLYGYYPTEYYDQYLYGPLFALLIAPFSMLPDRIGVMLWVLVGLLSIWSAVASGRLMGREQKAQTVYLWIILNELFIALLMTQFNLLLTGFMLWAYIYIKEDKPHLATLLITLSILTKIYGIVLLLFFPMIKRKRRFTLYLLFWGLLLALLPALFSSFDWLLDQYLTWFSTLTSKDGANTFSLMQNLGFIGFVRKVSTIATYSDLILILPAFFALLLPLWLHRQRWSTIVHNTTFTSYYLAALLLFIVLFSSGTESNTYIIGYAGIGLWWINRVRSGKTTHYEILLLIGAMILSHSTGDLFPKIFREQVLIKYALKSIFPMLIWIETLRHCYKQ